MTNADAIDLPGRVLLPDGTERDCTVRCGHDDRLDVILDVAVAPGAALVCHVAGLGVVEGVVGQGNRGKPTRDG